MMKQLSKYKAFFFDFDGVLADSVEVKTKAFAMLFEKFGSEIQNKVVEHHRTHGGMTRKEKFIYYYQNYLNRPLAHGMLDELCGRFSALVVDDVVAALEIPYSAKFLEKWHKKVICFVVSATPDVEIRRITTKRGINNYFREILGSSCPKTQHINYLLKKYNLSQAQCLFFGDAESDYKAATECGIDFMGILPGNKAPLLKIAPDITWVRDFAEMD